MQSTFSADKVLRGRVGRRCDRLFELLCGWLKEARGSADTSAMAMRDSILQRAVPEVWSLAAVCMEEAANEQVCADERVLEGLERGLRRKEQRLQRHADYLKRSWERAEDELQELRKQLGQTGVTEERQESCTLPDSYYT
jgi:hypothetical protein